MKDSPRHFDLVYVNPSHTWCFYTQHVNNPSEINFTNSDLAKLMDGQEKDLPEGIMPWIADISSVANAHIAALENPAAKGRYLIANAPFDFRQVVEIMTKNFSDAEWIANVPKGKPGTRQLERSSFFMLDNSHSVSELGIKYGPVE